MKTGRASLLVYFDLVLAFLVAGLSWLGAIGYLIQGEFGNGVANMIFAVLASVATQRISMRKKAGYLGLGYICLIFALLFGLAAIISFQAMSAAPRAAAWWRYYSIYAFSYGAVSLYLFARAKMAFQPPPSGDS